MVDDARATIALLARRAGWGVATGELDAALALGVDATVDRLVDPDGNGIAPAPDPWAGLDLTPPRPGPNASADAKKQAGQTERQQSDAAINAWLDHLTSTPRPLEDWMVWFWHGHFVSGLDKVKTPLLMVQQLRTFRALAFAPFAQLVKAATIDPAMLLYLDGESSTGRHPNENYGRELLELFTLGIGNYTEDDVQAGARALTGWAIDRKTGRSKFLPAGHDDNPSRYLGVDGVHDVDGVVAAVTQHPACAPFVSGKLARAILGPDVDAGLLRDLASGFAASGLDVRALMRSILEAAVQGRSVPMVVAPVPWLVAAQRATRGTIDPRARLARLRAAGQVPMMPPNVAGWPGGAAWFGASTVVARFGMASSIAASTPAGSALLVSASSPDP
ncbi:MAG TPA: DUF1800 family protein, partial [Acidimicrobiales bacterium]|nr:DUF1800 family protein [Acidimicrobiales bacterium]